MSHLFQNCVCSKSIQAGDSSSKQSAECCCCDVRNTFRFPRCFFVCLFSTLFFCMCVYLSSVVASPELRCIPSLGILGQCENWIIVCMSKIAPLYFVKHFSFSLFFYKSSPLPVHTNTHADTVMPQGPLQAAACPCTTFSQWQNTASSVSDMSLPSALDHMLHSSIVRFRQTVGHFDISLYISSEYLSMTQ